MKKMDVIPIMIDKMTLCLFFENEYRYTEDRVWNSTASLPTDHTVKPAIALAEDLTETSFLIRLFWQAVMYNGS